MCGPPKPRASQKPFPRPFLSLQLRGFASSAASQCLFLSPRQDHGRTFLCLSGNFLLLLFQGVLEARVSQGLTTGQGHCPWVATLSAAREHRLGEQAWFLWNSPGLCVHGFGELQAVQLRSSRMTTFLSFYCVPDTVLGGAGHRTYTLFRSWLPWGGVGTDTAPQGCDEECLTVLTGFCGK